MIWSFLAAKAQLNTCTCVSVCVSVRLWSKLNFSLLTPLYTLSKLSQAVTSLHKLSQAVTSCQKMSKTGRNSVLTTDGHTDATQVHVLSCAFADKKLFQDRRFNVFFRALLMGIWLMPWWVGEALGSGQLRAYAWTGQTQIMMSGYALEMGTASMHLRS